MEPNVNCLLCPWKDPLEEVLLSCYKPIQFIKFIWVACFLTVRLLQSFRLLLQNMSKRIAYIPEEKESPCKAGSYLIPSILFPSDTQLSIPEFWLRPAMLGFVCIHVLPQFNDISLEKVHFLSPDCCLQNF